MALFGPKQPGDSNVPAHDVDPSLPPLTLTAANDLILMTVDEFTRQGRACHYDDTGSVVSDGHAYGLQRLARQVSALPRSAWGDLVARHVGHLLAEEDREPESLRAAKALLMPQLLPQAHLPDPLPHHARQVLPGVAAVIVLDDLERVSDPLPEPTIERYGGWASVLDQAKENLRHLPLPAIRDITADEDRDDATIHILRYEDYFGAARVLVQTEILAEIGVEAPPNGVLVAVPNRHVLAFHIVRGEGVVPALRQLIRIADREFHSQPGAISPHVFFWTLDSLPQQVTAVDADGSLGIVVTGPLKRVFTRLGLVPE